LINDSKAIASTTPCALALVRRVPNSIANNAISSAASAELSRPVRVALREQPAGEQIEALRHRLELQRDVRHQAEQRDAGRQRADGRALAEARGEQIGNRGAVAAARLLHQAHQQRPGQQVQEDGADKSGRHPPAMPQRLGHRAVEGPRGAIDRQRQCVDPAPVPREGLRPTLAVDRGSEQQADPEGRAEGQQGAGGHGAGSSGEKGQGAGGLESRAGMPRGAYHPRPDMRPEREKRVVCRNELGAGRWFTPTRLAPRHATCDIASPAP
jgi:hypothetical protein